VEGRPPPPPPPPPPPLVDTTTLPQMLTILRELCFRATFADKLVDSERVAVLSEAALSNTVEYRAEAAMIFQAHEETRLPHRLPIGHTTSIASFTRADMRAFYEREYMATRMTLFVVGDIDADAVERLAASIFRGCVRAGRSASLTAGAGAGGGAGAGAGASASTSSSARAGAGRGAATAAAVAGRKRKGVAKSSGGRRKAALPPLSLEELRCLRLARFDPDAAAAAAAAGAIDVDALEDGGDGADGGDGEGGDDDDAVEEVEVVEVLDAAAEESSSDAVVAVEASTTPWQFPPLGDIYVNPATRVEHDFTRPARRPLVIAQHPLLPGQLVFELSVKMPLASKQLLTRGQLVNYIKRSLVADIFNERVAGLRESMAEPLFASAVFECGAAAVDDLG
jgi:hypothetical protein